MDLDEFVTSPAKRRRTDSPESTTVPTPGAKSTEEKSSMPNAELLVTRQEAALNMNSAAGGSGGEYGILDALMQHVESESWPKETGAGAPKHPIHTTTERPTDEPLLDQNEGGAQEVIVPESTIEAGGAFQKAADIEEEEQATTGKLDSTKDTDTPLVHEMPPVNTAQDAQPAAMGEAGASAEWELDSSPLNSSDSDSSDLSSSEDSGDDADEDYAMLDPEEQARILMQGDGGSDDEGGKSKDKGDVAPLRTANEKVEEVIPRPDIIVTEAMKIEELGKVEGIVESAVLVKAKISGEYQVLESGSLLCLKDRSVVGVVAETLGRVEQPLYTIRFTNDKAIEEAGLQKDVAVYYVPSHSGFVFTMPLRAVKGSDASNFHDEEVGDDEMEFSDDEAEAEHKRMMKANRRGKREDAGGRGRGGRGGRGSFRGDRQFVPNGDRGGQNDTAYGNGSLEINYDDMDGMEDGYTPLSRPTNFQELTDQGHSAAPPASTPFRGNYGQSRARGQGRGGYRGDRGGRSRGRGSWDRSSNGNFSGQSAMQQSPSAPFTPNQMLPPAQNQYQYQYQQPHQPILSAQNPSYPNFPFSPSPISPLPHQSFAFGGYGQQQQQQQQQQHPQGQSPLNPPFMQNFNHVAAAEVQRQLEQMRQNGGR